MKIYSYTDSTYPAPDFIHQEWPVPFLKGYAILLNESEAVHVYLLCDANNNCVPIRLRKSKIFKFGQLLFAPAKNGLPLEVEEEKIFFKKLLEFIKENNFCHRLQQPHPMGMTESHPDGSLWCNFGTYVNELQKGSDEDLLFTFDPKYRKAVQHSIKNGGRIEFGKNALDDFYTLYTTTTKRAGIYSESKSYFETALKNLPDHTDIGVVYDENGPIGSVFTLWSGYHALCTHAGSGGESKLYGGMKHLHYAMMLRMKNRGVQWYDLVGVRINSDHPSLQGVFRFKKGFGGELKSGYLWKTDISKSSMFLFDTLLKIKNKGKKADGDIIDQEQHNLEIKEVGINSAL